jgi:hypothetical protein
MNLNGKLKLVTAAIVISLVSPISVTTASGSDDKPGYVCFPSAPGSGPGNPGPGPLFNKVDPIYLNALEASAVGLSSLGTKLDANSISSMIGGLATYEAMRASGAGFNTLEAFQKIQTIKGGVAKLDKALPELVEQLELGKSSFEIEVK